MARKQKLIDIETAGFELDEKIIAWLSEKFPSVDPSATYELFVDKALAKAWIYANWSAAFRNYVRNGKQFGGLAFRNGMTEPGFDPLIKQAREIGFRMPQKHESLGVYRTALNTFDQAQAKQVGLRFGNVLKRIEKE